MLTVTVKSILEGVLKRAGIVPADATTDDKLAILDSIADRYSQAHKFYRWPFFTEIEQRYFRPVWSASSTYAADDEVYYAPTDAYYTCLSATSAGEDPEDTPAKWEELTEFNHQVDYEQDGETAIEAVIGAYDEDPRENASALNLDWQLREEGIGFAPDLEETSVWLEYRTRARDFRAEYIWDVAEAYTAGSKIYYGTTGKVYDVVTTTTAADAPDGAAAAKFSVVEFPEFLAQAVKLGVIADWFASDEKGRVSERYEARFNEALEEEVWQITKLQGQTGRPNVRPHS